MSDASRSADRADGGGPRRRARARLTPAAPPPQLHPPGRANMSRPLPRSAAARCEDDEHVRRLQVGRPGGRRGPACSTPAAPPAGTANMSRALPGRRPTGRVDGRARALDTRTPPARTGEYVARAAQVGGAMRGRRTCPTPPGRPTGRTAGARALDTRKLHPRGRRTCRPRCPMPAVIAVRCEDDEHRRRATRRRTCCARRFEHATARRTEP